MAHHSPTRRLVSAVAVEPLPEVASALKRSVAMNAWEAKVQVELGGLAPAPRKPGWKRAIFYQGPVVSRAWFGIVLWVVVSKDIFSSSEGRFVRIGFDIGGLWFLTLAGMVSDGW